MKVHSVQTGNKVVEEGNTKQERRDMRLRAEGNLCRE